MGPAGRSSPPMVVAGATVSVRGQVTAANRQRLGAVIGQTLHRHGIENDIRVRVSGSHCGYGPLLVQVNLALAGVAVRMQAVAPAERAGVAVAARLERQIARARDWAPRPWSGTPSAPSPVLLTPGEVVRRKQIVPVTMDPATAVRTMDAMDYDAHLFTDSESGEDAIVFRGGPWGLRLARQDDRRPPLAKVYDSGPAVLTVHPYPTPVLAESRAVARLCDHALPFLFHTDPGTGRGALLYRRYDGEIGLLSVATVSTEKEQYSW